MIFSVPHIIAFLTQGTTLDKGTVIVTGTPAGVGYTNKPHPILLQDGDNMTVSIAHIGENIHVCLSSLMSESVYLADSRMNDPWVGAIHQAR
jgi:2-keto-4-pentenoate hydratase/2-oxohepta-3-ene-1,7-dioic acid hydratase in catechol pathway